MYSGCSLFPAAAGPTWRQPGTGYSCGDGKQIHPCEEWYRRLQGRPLKKGDAIGLRQNMSTIENLPTKMDAGGTQ